MSHVYCIVFLFWYKPHYHRDSKFWIRYLVRTPVVITDDIIKASFLYVFGNMASA